MAVASASCEETATIVDAPDEVKMFLDAVGAILKDEGFLLPSSQASDALEAAKSLLEWSACAANKPVMSEFSLKLVQYLQTCLLSNYAQVDREGMWYKYHTLRTSKKFFILWQGFLKKSMIISGTNPIFFQFVTDHIFKKLIKQCIPVQHHTDDASVGDTDVESLSYEEKNVVRYAAGYITRKLYSKIKHSDNKSSLSLCLMDLIEADGGTTDDSQDWLRLLDRGGLKHVNTNMFLFVSTMEVVVKATLKQRDKHGVTDLKSQIVSAIVANEAVKSHWITVSGEWEPEESQVLFTMIVDLWVTMRGFSYASAWMEKHKQETKKTVQKSKGLRKNIKN